MVELEACCRLPAVDFGVLKVPIGSCARAKGIPFGEICRFFHDKEGVNDGCIEQEV